MISFVIFTFIVLKFAAHIGNVQAEACRSVCYNEQKPKCGITLEESSIADIEGIYELLDGLINLKCSFKSLPTPVQVHWKYRPKGDTKFHDIPCGNQRKTEECNFNGQGEHLTLAACAVRANWLNLTGMYRCEATQSSGTFLASDQADIEVIGIESIERKALKLRYGERGYIAIQVCANPKPQLFWHLPNGDILQPSQSAGKYSVSAIVNARTENDKPEWPSQYLQYCYRNKIVIADVDRMDHNIALLVQNEAESQKATLDLRVWDVPKAVD
jgi:hypothetical protein